MRNSVSLKGMDRQQKTRDRSGHPLRFPSPEQISGTESIRRVGRGCKKNTHPSSLGGILRKKNSHKGANPNLKLGKVKDSGTYFEGEIVTKDNSLVAKFGIDKNTGWVQPLY